MAKNDFGFPTFPIETPFGPALLTVQDSNYCCLTSFLGSGTDAGLTIHGVAYRTSLRAQYVGGEWTYCRYGEREQPDYNSLYMSRVTWTNPNDMNATPAARKKAAEVLFAAINQFFTENTDAPRAARVVKLRNDLDRQQEKVKEAVLLQEEAQRQVDQTRAELAGLLDDEGRKAAYTDERRDLIKEMEQRSLRDAIIAERELELQDLLSQTEGRRGACARYLTRDEIFALSQHFAGVDDELSLYLRDRDNFSPSAGQCYEVPVTNDEARELDRACELLGLGQ